MSLFSFSKNNKKDEEISIMFHIGSGSVSGSIIKLSKAKKPEIIYARQAAISFQKSLDLDRYLASMIKALNFVAKDIQKEWFLHLNFTGSKKYGIRNIFYILASPWCISQTKTIKIKKDRPFEVSSDFISDVLNEQEKKFLTADSSSNSEIIEKKVIHTKLNGYKTIEIYGKKAKEVELSFFLTSAPKYVLKALEDNIRKYFNFHSSNFHSSILASFSTIRDIYPDKENFAHLDVHGELTDLSVVKDNVFIENISFPMGRNFFIRHISERLRVSTSEANSLFNLYASGKCDEKTFQKIQSAIDESLENWSSKFNYILNSLSLRMYVPRTFFIIVDDEFGGFIVKELKVKKFSQFSLTEESFDVIILTIKEISDFCAFNANLSYKDPFMGFECVFLNKLFNTR